MQKLTDLCHPPIVGKKYIIRCIETTGFDVLGSHLLPVIGDFHSDREIIGFPDEHIHIDWRFVNHQCWKSFTKEGLKTEMVFSKVISREYVIGEEEKALRCNRNFPQFPLQIPEHHIPWFPKLEKAYCNKKTEIDDCKERCPHRGINLSS
jgi:hypothetical protein